MRTTLKDLIRLLKLTRPYAGTYSVAIAALVAGSAAFLFIPPQLGRVIASLQSVAEGHSSRAAIGAVVACAALLAFHGVAALVYTFLVSFVSERIVNDLRARFFDNLVNQRLDRHPPKALGQVASEFASDLSLVQDGLSTTLIDTIRHALVTAGAFTALFLIDFKMTVIALAGVGAVAGVLLLFIRRATASIMAVQQWRAKVMALLLEAAANAYIIQAYGRTTYMSARFASWLNGMFSRVWRQMLLMACMSPVCLVLFAAVMTAMAAYSMQQLRSAHLTIPMLISYFTFAAVLVASVSQVGYLAGRLRQAGAILARHERMLSLSAGPAGGGRLLIPRVQVVRNLKLRPYGFDVRNVTFAYPGQVSPAVSDVSFTVPPGKVTAIVGESGAGKSTVAAMLCGLYQPQHGSIRVIGQDGGSTCLEPSALGQQIAIVPQEPFLFAGTILENITFGRENITESHARNAAGAARIHDFIMALPGGYSAHINEAGKNLSRGQRQRLAIARALVGNPSVIILDEATASLDVVSERAIKAVIDHLRERVTFVIIAHQGALLSGADCRIVLRCGAVRPEGDPAALPVESGGVLC